MITEEQLEMARADFEKYFGNGERATVKRDRLGMEEVIIVENHFARAQYSLRENGLVELKHVKKK